MFFVSADSKGLSIPINHLESTLTEMLVNVACKGLDVGRLRPKTGKTRCLSVTAHFEGLIFVHSCFATSERPATLAELGEQSRPLWDLRARAETQVRRDMELAGRGGKLKRAPGWSLANTPNDSKRVSIG